MSSRHAQCSTITPSATRQTCTNFHAVGTARDGGVGQQRHRGSPMGPVQGEVLRGEIAVTDEVVLLDRDGPEVVVDHRQDQLEALAPLRTGGMIHHVLGHEIVEHRVVTGLLPPEHLLDDILRTPFAHPAISFIAPASSTCVARNHAVRTAASRRQDVRRSAPGVSPRSGAVGRRSCGGCPGGSTAHAGDVPPRVLAHELARAGAAAPDRGGPPASRA